MENRELKTRIGLAATTFTLVGFVLGVSVFVLPAQIGAKAGPAVAVTYLLAALPAFFSCFVAAQVGNLFPISGAGYVCASAVLSPLWGFIIVWNIIICMILGIPFVAYASADCWLYFFPDHDRMIVAAAIVLIFGLVNLVGVKFTTGFQAAMIIVYILVILAFVVGGLAHMNPDYLRPFAPNGWSPVLMGAVEASFAFGGFMVIAEMGDEIDNPKRTIPRALLISFILVVVLYGGAAFVLPGLIPWQDLGATNSPISKAAGGFFPPWFGTLVAISALLGGATTVNAWFLTQTRDIYALARDQVFPKVLAHVSRKHAEPDAAIIFATFASLGGVLMGAQITEYAIMSVVASFVIYMIISLAVFLAPRRVPEHYARAQFKLGPVALPFFSLGFLLLCLAIEVIACLSSPKSVGIYLMLLIPGFVYYALRKRALRSRGVNIEDMLMKDLRKVLTRDAGEAASK